MSGKKLSDHRYFRRQDLRQLRYLIFSPRRTVEGLYSGHHRSRQRGQSVEFTDYREYTPGDEVGDIDWKVYGRSDRLFIRLFEHQPDMTVQLLVDASASMAFAGCNARSDHRVEPDHIEQLRKLDQALLLAASIAFLTVKQQDKVGFGIAQEGLDHHVQAAGSYTHLHQVLSEMDRVEPIGRASLAESITQLARRSSGRSLMIVFSDLLEAREPVLAALDQFTHRGGEVIVFHVLHSEELCLPRLGQARFLDSENHQQLRVNIEEIRIAYEGRMHGFIEGWATSLRHRSIDYNVVSTGMPYHRALDRYLFNRAAAHRGGRSR